MTTEFCRKNLASVLPPEAPRHSVLSDDEGDGFDEGNLFLTKEDFVVILPDDDFVSKTGGVMKKKVVRSESIHGKLERKLGAVKVISLSESQDDEWIGMLYPGPREHMIYRKHPFEKKNIRYIGADLFHHSLMDDMHHELTRLLRLLGARSVTWEGHAAMDSTFECPDAMGPYLLHADEFRFLSHMQGWQDLVRDRLDEEAESYSLRFVYEDDFHVNDELVEKALGKMNIDKVERKQLFAEHVARESFTESGHPRILLSHSIMSSRHPEEHLGLFQPTRITVHVEFFTSLDYWEFNRAWIATNWSSLHVQAFLRLIGLSRYEGVFYEDEVDGETLITVISNPQETLTESLKMAPKDVLTLKDQVRRLGLPDDLAVLAAVQKEECRVRAERDREVAVMVRAAESSTAKKSGGAKTPTSSGKSGAGGGVTGGETETEGSAHTFTEGVFEIVMVGDGAVGKTSIMNRVCGKDFNSTEKPTIGTRLAQHTLGKLVIDVWDSAGQHTQFGSVKAKSRRADIILAVYDVSNKDSLRVLEERLTEIVRDGLQPWASIVLLGNKADFTEQFRQVSLQDGLFFARDHTCCAFFETSAKTGYNVQEAVTNAVLKTEQGRLAHITSCERESFRLGGGGGANQTGQDSESSCGC